MTGRVPEEYPDRPLVLQILVYTLSADMSAYTIEGKVKIDHI